MPSTLMLLSNPYRPDPRVLRETRALIEAGIAVHLIAWDRGMDRPSYAVEGGVMVTRLGPKSAYRSISQVGCGLIRFWFRALWHAKKAKFDAVHCHDFDTFPLGLVIARLHGKPLILDAHDIYSLMVVGESASVGKFLWIVERWLVTKADELITTNTVMADILSEKRGKGAVIVSNSPDTSDLIGHDIDWTRAIHGLDGFVVPYLGSLEPGRAVEELATAFSPGDGITVIIGGSGTLQLAIEMTCRNNPTTHFVGNIDTDEVLRITEASDIIPAMYDPSNPKYKICTPIKVLEAMACGKAVITTKGLDISEMVERIGCGFVIDYSREALRRTVLDASKARGKLDEMGRRGKEYFEQYLSWAKSKDALINVYRGLQVVT